MTRTGAGSPLITLLLSLLMLAGALGVLVAGAINLAPDFAIRADPVIVDSASLEGECETKRAVITSCDTTMTYLVEGVTHRVERDYIWIGTAQDYAADVVVAADRPDLATVSVALDRLWNRTLTILGGFLLFGVLGLGGLRQWRTVRSARRRYRPETAQRLFPVVVPLVGAKDVPLRGCSYQFTVPVGGKQRKREQLLNKAEGAPFLVGPGSALAVHAEGAEAHPVLLDAGLTRLDLTDEERAQLSSPTRQGDDVS
ncbi:MAG TPA: hypothetical protein VFT81_04220 [Dermatophilaceae bacterium]|nr:hypothetical protein [Dermatophilaceae bacterium]